ALATPGHVPPDRPPGKPVTRRSDLYALGVVLYTLATGRTPFVGDPVDLMHKHRFGQFDRPSRLEPQIHPDFEEIICNLLEKDPEKRPPDAGVLHRRLDSLRRKIARVAANQTGNTLIDRNKGLREGPATLMSRLMRQELEAQNTPGLIYRLLHHPVMLVLLFALSVGILTWTFWPASAESLFQRGAALMASDDPSDW